MYTQTHTHERKERKAQRMTSPPGLTVELMREIRLLAFVSLAQGPHTQSSTPVLPESGSSWAARGKEDGEERVRTDYQLSLLDSRNKPIRDALEICSHSYTIASRSIPCFPFDDCLWKEEKNLNSRLIPNAFPFRIPLYTKQADETFLLFIDELSSAQSQRLILRH